VTEQVKTMRTFGIILLGLTIAFDSLGQATSDQREVSQAVTSFYTWYMGTTKDKRYSEYVKGAKDENGNTKLETTEYFKKLAAEIDIPYQNLMNMYLRECAQNNFKPNIHWQK